MLTLILIFAAFTPALTVNGPDVQKILRQARQAADALPEKWTTEITIADYRTRQETGDKYRALQNIAIAQAEVGDIRGAEETIECIHSPIVPKAFTNNFLRPTLIPLALAQSRTSDSKSASATLQKAIKTLIAAPNRTDGLSNLAEMAVAQAKVGDLAGAKATAALVLKAAEDAVPATMIQGRSARLDRTSGLLIAARALDAAGEHEAAETVLLRARQSVANHIDREPPTPVEHEAEIRKFRASGLASLVIDRAKVGEFPAAWRLYREFLPELEKADRGLARGETGLVEMTLTNLAFALAETDWAGAMRAIDLIPGDDRQAVTILQIVRSSAPGTVDRADVVRRLRKAFESPEPQPDFAFKDFLLVNLADAEAKAGDRAASLATARRALALVHHPDGDFLIRVARIQAEAGDRPAAIETLRRARTVIDAEKSDTYRFQGLAAFAGTVADFGDGDWAMGTLASIPPQYVVQKNRAAKAITLARAKSGDMAGTFRAMNALVEDRQDPRTLLMEAEEVAEQVAFERAKAGQVQWALDWAEGQKIPLAKVRALIGAARGLADRPGGPPGPR